MAVALVNVNVVVRRDHLDRESIMGELKDALSSLAGAEVEVKIEGGLIDGNHFGAEEWESLK